MTSLRRVAEREAGDERSDSGADATARRDREKLFSEDRGRVVPERCAI